MLELIQTLMKPLFNLYWGKNYQTNLDKYVSSKNPTSSAEVDFWVREYERNLYGKQK